MAGVKNVKLQLRSMDVTSTHDSVNFCNNVGCGGVMMLSFTLVLGIFHVWIYGIYTEWFTQERHGVWIFMWFFSCHVGLVLYHSFTWRKRAKNANIPPKKPSTCLGKVRAFKHSFQVNGKWFLVYIFSCEVVETVNQIYNLISIYSCTLPPWIIFLLCMLLFLDQLYRLYFLRLRNSVFRRDALLLIDLFVDLLCMALPISFMFFGYGIPLTVAEILLITTAPSLFSISRLDEILEENVLRHQTIDR